MMKPIANYAIHVNFNIDRMYVGPHSRLCYLCIFCMDGIYDGAILHYGIHLNFNMDGIYDGTHCRLWYLCTFYRVQNL